MITIMAHSYNQIDENVEIAQHEVERVWNRNLILKMELPELQRLIQQASPSLYDDAVKVAENDSQALTLRHGDRITEGESFFRCLQAMMLYYKQLYKKDCRVWMYKSCLTDLERTRNDLNHNGSDQEIESASQKRHAATDSFAYNLDRAPFKLMCTNERQNKPISTPELSANTDSKPEASVMSYVLKRHRSGIRKLSTRRGARRMTSKSDTILNQPRDRADAHCVYAISSNCQINEDAFMKEEYYCHIVKHQPGIPNAAIKSYTNTTLLG
jgi:hypothetical protein